MVVLVVVGAKVVVVVGAAVVDVVVGANVVVVVGAAVVVVVVGGGTHPAGLDTLLELVMSVVLSNPASASSINAKNAVHLVLYESIDNRFA